MTDNNGEREPGALGDFASKTGTDDRNRKADWSLRAVVDGPDGLSAIFGGDDTHGIRVVDVVGGSADQPAVIVIAGSPVIDRENFQQQMLRRPSTRMQGDSSLAMQVARNLYPVEGMSTGPLPMPFLPILDVHNEDMLFPGINPDLIDGDPQTPPSQP